MELWSVSAWRTAMRREERDVCVHLLDHELEHLELAALAHHHGQGRAEDRVDAAVSRKRR